MSVKRRHRKCYVYFLSYNDNYLRCFLQSCSGQMTNGKHEFVPCRVQRKSFLQLTVNSSKNITCPSGKLKTEFTSPRAKSTSPGPSNTTFFASWPCDQVFLVPVITVPYNYMEIGRFAPVLHLKNRKMSRQKHRFELFLSAHFLFWKFLNLNLTFAICHKIMWL